MKNTFRAAATSLVLILVVALAARLFFAWDQQRKIPTAVLGVVPFQQETGNIAYALAQGRGFASVFRGDTGPTAWLAPVYPFLVAATFKLFGAFTVRSFFACVSLNALFSAAVCVPIFYAGKRVARLGVAAAAAWLWALFPNAIMFPFEWIWDTSLSALLASTILWATLAVAESRSLRAWPAYGLLWGFTLMTNPALGSLLPFLLVWAMYRARSLGTLRVSRPLLAAAVIILCCAPWAVRNYVVFHRFIPLRSNFPFELWLGNNDVYDFQTPNTRTRITQFEEVRRYTQLGEIPFMQEKWEQATHFMLSHPQLELHLIADRFVATWTGLASPFRSFLDTDSWLARAILLCNVLAAGGALFGIIVLWRGRSPFLFPLAAFPVVFPLLYYLTHTSLRYRHPIDPVLLLLLAIAAHAALSLLRPAAPPSPILTAEASPAKNAFRSVTRSAPARFSLFP